MTIKYAQTAWSDIKSSPNRFGKMLLLGLVGLIPIFGSIVVYGYLLNWTREIAWRYKTPLPPRIFGNENGNLYKLGFFALVVSVVVYLILEVANAFLGVGVLVKSLYHSGLFAGIYSLTTSSTFLVLSLALGLFLTLLSYASFARMSVYGTLSSGFQVNRLWEMIRFDAKGLLKIVGMTLLIALIAYLALAIIFGIMLFAFAFLAVGATGDLGFATHHSLSRAMSVGFGVSGITFVFELLVFCYLTSVVLVFLNMMVFRSLGYWVSQMNVAQWGPQDAPVFAAAANQPTNVSYAQPQHHQQPYTPPVSWEQNAVPQQPVQPQAPAQPQTPAQPQAPAQPQTPAQQQTPVQQPSSGASDAPANPHEGA